MWATRYIIYAFYIRIFSLIPVGTWKLQTTLSASIFYNTWANKYAYFIHIYFWKLFRTCKWLKLLSLSTIHVSHCKYLLYTYIFFETCLNPKMAMVTVPIYYLGEPLYILIIYIYIFWNLLELENGNGYCPYLLFRWATIHTYYIGNQNIHSRVGGRC